MKRIAAVTALFAAVLLGTAASGLSGQITDTATVDRILAVVGNKAILLSEVQEEVFGRVRDRKEGLPDGAKDSAGFNKAMKTLLRRYTDTLVAFELLYNEAQTDTTIKVTDQEVQDAADQIITATRKDFKSTAEFKAQLRLIGFATEEDWRKWLLENQRRTLTVHRYEAALKDDNKIKDMTPTAKEVRAFYDAHMNEFPPSPATVSIKQIIIAPKPDSAAKAKARSLADSLVRELRKPNADFADFARRFSMDEVSKAEGGNLDWFPHGRMVREFDDVVFNLKQGTISEPFESPFGIHIAQVQRIQPGEVQARHILIIPDVDSADAKAAHDQAQAVYDALQHGATFDSLQHLYHDRGEELEATAPIDSIAITPYGPAIAGLDSGKVSKPFLLPVKGAPLHSKWVVVQVTRRTVAGPPPFDDVQTYLRRTLAAMLGEQDYINQLRVRTYVDIRSP